MDNQFFITFSILQKILKDITIESLINKLPNLNIYTDNKDLIIYLPKNEILELLDNKDLKCFYLADNVLNNFSSKQLKDINEKMFYRINNAIEYNKESKTLSYFHKIYKDTLKVKNYILEAQKDFFTKKILCFDIEAYELEQSKLTEIGISILENYKIHTKHYIVEENLHLRNGKYVEDNKDNFLLGISEIKPLKEIINILIEDINKSDTILGHGIHNDFKYLNSNSQEKLLRNNFNVIDSYKLSNYYNVDGLGIKKMLEELNIEYKYLHNAGNDAYFNIKMAAQFIKDVDLNLLDQKIEKYKLQLSNYDKYFNNKWNQEKDIINKELDFNC